MVRFNVSRELLRHRVVRGFVHDLWRQKDFESDRLLRLVLVLLLVRLLVLVRLVLVRLVFLRRLVCLVLVSLVLLSLLVPLVLVPFMLGVQTELGYLQRL